MTGIELITRERQEQLGRHGYSATHDDTHDEGELAQAAASLILDSETLWPWPDDKGCNPHLKTKPQIERLAIAGALIAAEIDRLLRAEFPCPQV